MNKFSFKAEGDFYPKNLLQHGGTIVVHFKDGALDWTFNDIRYFLKHWPDWNNAASYDLIYDKDDQ